MYRDTTNVEPEMYDNTGNNWSHRNSNKNGKYWKSYQGNIQWIHLKRQLYLEHDT